MSEGEVAVVVSSLLLIGVFLGYMYAEHRWPLDTHKVFDIQPPPRPEFNPWVKMQDVPSIRQAIHPRPPPRPKHKPSKQPPEFKVINTTSHPCTVTVTSMGPGEYHITLSDTGEQHKG